MDKTKKVVYEVMLRDNISLINKMCFLCREIFSLDISIAFCENEKLIGFICGECFKAGSKNISTMLKKHAKELREEAKYFESLADKPIKFSTWEEY